jgi:hypothetical protein
MTTQELGSLAAQTWQKASQAADTAGHHQCRQGRVLRNRHEGHGRTAKGRCPARRPCPSSKAADRQPALTPPHARPRRPRRAGPAHTHLRACVRLRWPCWRMCCSSCSPDLGRALEDQLRPCPLCRPNCGPAVPQQAAPRADPPPEPTPPPPQPESSKPTPVPPPPPPTCAAGRARHARGRSWPLSGRKKRLETRKARNASSNCRTRQTPGKRA